MASISELENQINSLKSQAGTYQDRLNSSPTALAGSDAPTQGDISNQTTLQSIRDSITKLTNDKLKQQWYPPADPNANSGEGVAKPGIIGSTVDFISRPLYAVIGAGKHFLGQGRGSLGQDMADNILRDKSTAGDVLKTAGLPWAVSAPLGLALDIGLDPVNWATMGSTALLPGLAEGAYRGAAEEGLMGAFRGIKAAGESNLLSKATQVARFTPFLKNTPTFEKLAGAARTATEGFENLTGRTAERIVQERGMGVGSYRIGLGDIVNRVAQATPGGQKFLEAFTYDPVKWVHDSHVKDTLLRSLGTDMDVSGAVKAGLKGESIEPFMKTAEASMAEKIASTPSGPAVDLMSIDLNPSYTGIPQKEVDLAMSKLAAAGVDTTKITGSAPSFVNGIDDAVSLMKNPKLGLTTDPIENILRIANEASGPQNPLTLEDIGKIMKSHVFGETGVKWFDKLMTDVRNTKYLKVKFGDKIYNVGNAVMDKYEQGMGIFRSGKIGASPVAHVNAWVGNLGMRHLSLGDLDGAFLSRLKQARDVVHDRPGAALLLDDLLDNHIKAGLKEYESAAKGTIGNLDFIGARNNAERIYRASQDAGIIPAGMTASDMVPEVQGAMDTLLQIKNDALKKLKLNSEGGLEPVKKLLAKGGAVDAAEVGTGMGANELLQSSAARRMFDTIAEKAKTDGSYTWKALDFMFNKASSEYETIDQTYKLADTIYATKDGLTMPQLSRIRHYIDIAPEDLKKVVGADGKWRYQLSAPKALEMANVTYMNYNAMPAAIRVLRNMPLIGSPFSSFMYAMSLKTAQALAYNPSAFTKVGFAMQEFGGQKTPLEKKALQGNIYGYLNAPGMFRVPFFDENPIYINLTNMIPYYSMNMFNPSESSFNSNALPPKLVEAVQKSPLMKDPFGSALFDYVIQPLILGEAIAPQGQFGQPLYPVGANAGEKSLYGLRSLGEAFTPNAMAYAGLITPEAMAKFMPSYRWRQLSEAKVGKNEIGISTKESIPSRTLRTTLSASGLPVQAPVNLNFVQGQN